MVIASILNFLIVVYILWYFTRKPAAQFLQNRTEVLGHNLKEAEKIAGEAKALLTEWESRWKASEAHAKKLQDEASASLARTMDQSISEARKEARRIQEEVKLVSQSEIVRSKEQLRQEFVQKSVEMAREFLSAHLTEKDQHKLVSNYMEIVSNGTTG